MSLSYRRAFQIVHALNAMACAGLLTHAVYTTPNVPASSLKATVRALVLSWKRLHGLTGGKSKPDPAAEPVLGAVRNLEITYNPQEQTYHPHIHAILHAPRLDQDAYTWAWDVARTKAGLPSVPTLVYLQRLRPRADRPVESAGVHPVNTSESQRSADVTGALERGRDRGRLPDPDPDPNPTNQNGQNQQTGTESSAAPTPEFLDAAFEVSKYCVKPSDGTSDDGFPTYDLPKIIMTLKGLHVSQATGSIREHITPPEPEEEPTHYMQLGGLNRILKESDLP
ncbi:MAG: protein rep, partial [Acidobacteria bacterium]|nr:protein rep [Acidobacteriota bacterium]